MNEESLQRLFEELRKAPAETSMEDVSSWINPVKIDNPAIDKTNLLTKPKIVIMASSIAVIATSTILLLTPQKNQVLDKTELSPVPVKNELQSAPFSKEKNYTPLDKELPIEHTNQSKPTPGPAMHQVIPVPIVSAERQEEIKPVSDVVQTSQNNTSLALTNKNQESASTIAPADTSGLWTTKAEKLTIDTIFAGINKIVLISKYPSQIKIEGSQRNNIAFNYQYNYQIKGLYAGKNPGSKVSYKKSGTTLTITVELNKGFTVGISYVKITSNVSIAVPENISVSINSNYGDITAKNLLGGIIQLDTKYGDIEAQSLIGNISLQSGYGDITLKEADGKINVSTKYGHIKAHEIKVDDSIRLSSGYGNVDCRLLSKEESCRLSLSTGFGKLSVKGKAVDIESTKKIQYGTGASSVTVSSSFGDVKIRFIELNEK
jgi:hypothetical protein